jgi:hypothetical protein
LKANRDPIAKVSKRHGVSKQTIYTWRKRFGELKSEDVRVASARPRPQAPTAANQVWSYDFVFDHCANGQRLKCLTVTDEFTKEGLEAVAFSSAKQIRCGDEHAGRSDAIIVIGHEDADPLPCQNFLPDALGALSRLRDCAHLRHVEEREE